MALVFVSGILSASTSIKVESSKTLKNCKAGDQLEMSITLDDLEGDTCEITVFIESGENIEKLGTITCRKGKNLGKWLISKKYAGKAICLKFVDNKENIMAYSNSIKIEKNKSE